MKLWIFGHSACAGYNLQRHELSWPDLVSKKLNLDVINLSQDGADNLFVYNTVMSNCDQIKDTDLVIVGWSHPNRKSFVLDLSTPSHQEVLKREPKIYSGDPPFFRNYNRSGLADSILKWSKNLPVPRGDEFFDNWFENYFSSYESRLNFRAYLDSAIVNLPKNYLPFYFSKESIDTVLPVNDNDFYWLDFVVKHGYQLSPDDYHPNQQGHEEIAKIFVNRILNCNSF